MGDCEICWSYSRWQLFNRCERAYFYQYCSADGMEECDCIFHLKKLSHADWIISNILHDALFAFFHENKHSSPIKLAEKDFLRTVFRLYKSAFSADAQSRIYELFYDEAGGGEQAFLKRKYDKLYALAEIIIKSDFFLELYNVPYLSFKWLPCPVQFAVNDINVWTRPMLVWQNGAKVNFGHIASQFNEKQFEMQLAANALLAQYSFLVRIENMVFIVFSLKENKKYEFVVTTEMISDLENCIRTSITEMEEKQSSDYDVYKENCKMSKQCLSSLVKGDYINCRFKALCCKNY